MSVSSRIRMRHIRCFLAVSRAKSVTAAAQKMNSSQPAVSRSLAELEEIIGAALFVRSGHGLTLTEPGTNLFRYLDTAVSQIESGALLASGRFQRNKVSVGMLPNVARTLSVEAAAGFKTDLPGVDLELHWAGIPELINRLHRSEVDFLLGRLLSLEHLEGVSFEHLYTESIIFAVHHEHPFAQRPDAASLEDLRGELVLTPLPNTIVRREMDKFLMGRGFDRFPNQIETVSFEFMRSFLTANRAVACLPLGAVRAEIAAGKFVQLGIRGEELVSSVGMTFVSGRRLSDEAVSFCECVRSAAEKYR